MEIVEIVNFLIMFLSSLSYIFTLSFIYFKKYTIKLNSRNTIFGYSNNKYILVIHNAYWNVQYALNKFTVNANDKSTM